VGLFCITPLPGSGLFARSPDGRGAIMNPSSPAAVAAAAAAAVAAAAAGALGAAAAAAGRPVYRP
jgi:hypothetical protein